MATATIGDWQELRKSRRPARIGQYDAEDSSDAPAGSLRGGQWLGFLSTIT